jgi:peptide/nickel transport system permease protein
MSQAAGVFDSSAIQLGYRRRRFGGLVNFVRVSPLGAVGVLVVVLMTLMAVLAPWVAPYTPSEIAITERLQSPSAEHWMGTDNLGRDVLSRLMHGARLSLSVSLFAVAFGAIIGSTIGLISGYFGGRVDFVVQRVMDVLQAFPLLILALVIVSMLGASFQNIVSAIAIVLIPGYSRVARGATITVRRLPYIDAATTIGAPTPRIMIRHVIPNISAPLLVLATASLGSAILVETSLSFLGLSASPTAPSLGGMLSVEGRAAFQDAPWLAIFPGLAISLIVLGFNLAGDGLRDAWDPALKSR